MREQLNFWSQMGGMHSVLVKLIDIILNFFPQRLYVAGLGPYPRSSLGKGTKNPPTTKSQPESITWMVVQCEHMLQWCLNHDMFPNIEKQDRSENPPFLDLHVQKQSMETSLRSSVIRHLEIETMNGANQPLVTDEPIEVQDYGTYL